LKASLIRWLVRDDQDDYVGEYISLAESRLDREIIGPDRETTVALTAAASVTLPTDFDSARTVWLDTDPKTVLDQMPLGELYQAYAAAATGSPGNFAISGTSMILGPSPDSAYSLQLTYRRAIPTLGAAVPNNWLLLKHADVYLSASLVEAYLALKDESRAQLWDARTVAKVSEINRAGIRKQYGAAPFRIRSATVV
jgi:hypothetical protein